jgi:RimJ/RimL family protein N-acetyltransferase
MAGELTGYPATERLKDGRQAVVRPIRPDDKERLLAAFRGLTPETVYTRIFTHKSELSAQELARLTEIDFVSEVALVVTLGDGNTETIIASGRYFAFDGDDGRRRAEVAFTVEEDFHGMGIAGMLLRHLAAIARRQGIACLEAEVLPANQAMLRVFARSGLPLSKSVSDTAHVTLYLTDNSD